MTYSPTLLEPHWRILALMQSLKKFPLQMNGDSFPSQIAQCKAGFEFKTNKN